MNHRDIINFIKAAQGVPVPKGKRPAVTPTQPSTPTPGQKPESSPVNKPTGTYVVSASTIRDMQKAITTFVDTAIKYKTTKVRDGNKIKSVVAPDDNRKDFNDFLAEQYSANSSVKGDEWTTSPTATTKESKQPTDIIELDNIFDSLRRTGRGSSEQMPDGIWDFRTNNAVKNICAVADALVRVTEDFGGVFPNMAFRRADLTKLMDAVPKVKDPRSLNPAELKQRAEIITSLIEKLTQFYKGYYKYIIDHPSYKEYIDKTRALYTATPGGEDPGAMPTELQQYNNQHNQLYLQNMVIPGKTGNQTFSKLPISILDSVENLQTFMSKTGRNGLGYDDDDINNEEILKKVFYAIYAQVSYAMLTAQKIPGVMQSAPKQQTPATQLPPGRVRPRETA